jgi:hypothetical protein
MDSYELNKMFERMAEDVYPDKKKFIDLREIKDPDERQALVDKHLNATCPGYRKPIIKE